MFVINFNPAIDEFVHITFQAHNKALADGDSVRENTLLIRNLNHAQIEYTHKEGVYSFAANQLTSIEDMTPVLQGLTSTYEMYETSSPIMSQEDLNQLSSEHRETLEKAKALLAKFFPPAKKESAYDLLRQYNQAPGLK